MGDLNVYGSVGGLNDVECVEQHPVVPGDVLKFGVEFIRGGKQVIFLLW